MVLNITEHIFGFLKLEQGPAYQRKPGKIKAPAPLLQDNPAGGSFSFSLREGTQIPQGQSNLPGLLNALYRLTIHRGKNGTENFVAADNLRKCLTKGWNMQITMQANYGLSVISKIGWIELMDKPDSFLSKREGKMAIACYRQQQRA